MQRLPKSKRAAPCLRAACRLRPSPQCRHDEKVWMLTTAATAQVRYCGKPCQTAHWKYHKEECRRVQREREGKLKK